jgi:hypothetical protein
MPDNLPYFSLLFFPILDSDVRHLDPPVAAQLDLCLALHVLNVLNVKRQCLADRAIPLLLSSYITLTISDVSLLKGYGLLIGKKFSMICCCSICSICFLMTNGSVYRFSNSE